jgi:hypothetical protein
VFGYKGKQVRDNIHSSDVIQFMNLFIQNPRIAEVYNIGGGKDNSCSILEAFDLVESVSGKKMIYEYVEENRIGDHICYYSDLSKISKIVSKVIVLDDYIPNAKSPRGGVRSWGPWNQTVVSAVDDFLDENPEIFQSCYWIEDSPIAVLIK